MDSVNERLATLENERQHTTAALLNIAARLDKADLDRKESHNTLAAQISELREVMIRNRGFIAGLMAAAGLGGGIIGAKGQALLQLLTMK